MNDVNATLEARGKTYGKFIDVAACSQALKEIISLYTPNHKRYNVDQKEALDMICMKIARIVAGDADHVDSWHDIAGYAKLVEDRLNGKIQ
ncbi:MAG: DUF6378 domain-containing protein [Thermoplasmatales archaeon]